MPDTIMSRAASASAILPLKDAQTPRGLTTILVPLQQARRDLYPARKAFDGGGAIDPASTVYLGSSRSLERALAAWL
ncbi:hypothetical protein BRX36_00990 [Sphingomonas sp. S-NIH.Pt1_0416]|nr:hypothetical protein BRX36_00990 [Sphingomonas sp. S-NIH.Pt1_0416]